MLFSVPAALRSALVASLLALGASQPALAQSAPAQARLLGLSTDRPLAQNPSPQALARLQSLRARVAESGTLRVIVGVRAPFAPEGQLDAAGRGNQRSAIAKAQKAALRKVPRSAATGARSLASVPFMTMTVDAAQLEALAALAEVTDIQEDLQARASLPESTALVRATQAWAAGAAGGGWAVAVLDDGVQKTHPFVAAAVLSEACYSTQSPLQGYYSMCPNRAGSSTASGAASYCADTTYGAWACGHGTHVAGIAAGDGRDAGLGYSGVARDAGLIPIQVFTWYAPGGYATAFFSDIDRGLERVGALASAGTKIAAVNMSLGGGLYTAECDTSFASTKALIDNLRSLGIATVVASGNDGYTDRLSAPGCISSAVSVGATFDAGGFSCDGASSSVDKMACYSNTAGFLDLLAPGSAITSSVSGGSYGVKHGTSMATPHVAGCWAVLKSAKPTATADQIEAALKTTGTLVTDYRNGAIVKPRIDCEAARVALLDQSATVSHTLTVSVSGSGSVSGAGIACPGDCTESYPAGTQVTLGATAAAGNVFTGWGGGCSGTGSCVLTASDGAGVSANFASNPQTVQFGSATAAVTEGTSTVKVPVTRSSPLGTATVNYATFNGSAVAGQDYKSLTGTLSFPAGVTTLNLSLGILNDSLFEMDETFEVRLLDPSAGISLGTPSTATVTVRDNGDRNVEFEATAVSVDEGAGTVTLMVRRVGPTSAGASVNYSTSSDSARSGRDFAAASGTLTWAAGETASKAFTVTVLEDITREGAESFTVKLASPVGATLGLDKTARVTILASD